MAKITIRTETTQHRQLELPTLELLDLLRTAGKLPEGAAGARVGWDERTNQVTVTWSRHSSTDSTEPV